MDIETYLEDLRIKAHQDGKGDDKRREQQDLLYR